MIDKALHTWKPIGRSHIAPLRLIWRGNWDIVLSSEAIDSTRYVWHLYIHSDGYGSEQERHFDTYQDAVKVLVGRGFIG